MSENVGSRLKKIRLEKGLALEEVQKKTKIHLSVLKAIEEDNFMNLSQIYIKGFLKIYCKFLGLDPGEYISDYKGDYRPAHLSPVIKTVQEKSPPSFDGLLAKLRSFKVNKKVRNGIIVFLAFIFLAAGLFNLGKFISQRRAVLVKEGRPARATSRLAKTKKKKPALASLQPQQAQAVVVPEQPEKPSFSGIRLSMLSREDCLVTLKIDGRLVFHGVLKKGKTESWQAKDKMELSLGNAGAVELIVNGERIAPLGKKGQPRKNIMITKKGLTSG